MTLIGLALLAGVFGFALWKGDAAARLGAFVYAGGWVLAIGIELYTHSIPFAAILSLDTLVATGFLVLAIRYNSLWLGAAMMLQGIQLGMHAMYFTSTPDATFLGFNLFVLTLNLISLFILITIAGAVGATLYRRGRQRRALLQHSTASAAAKAKRQAAPPGPPTIAVRQGLSHGPLPG